MHFPQSRCCYGFELRPAEVRDMRRLIRPVFDLVKNSESLAFTPHFETRTPANYVNFLSYVLCFYFVFKLIVFICPTVVGSFSLV